MWIQQEITEEQIQKYADEYEESLPEDSTWVEHYKDSDAIHGVCSVCEIEKAYKAGFKKSYEVQSESRGQMSQLLLYGMEQKRDLTLRIESFNDLPWYEKLFKIFHKNPV